MFFKEISRKIPLLSGCLGREVETCSDKSLLSQLSCSLQPLPLWLHRESLACILYNGFCSAYSFHWQKALSGGLLHLPLQLTPTAYPTHREYYTTTSVESTCSVSSESSIATLRHHFHLNSISAFPRSISGLSVPHTQSLLPGLQLIINNFRSKRPVGFIWH